MTMSVGEASPTWLLEQEARALVARLEGIKPFVLQETAVAAAALSPAAMSRIEDYLIGGRLDVHRKASEFLWWLRGPGRNAPPEECQRRFWSLRFTFQVTLAQLDLFSEVVTQRSEHDNGVLLSGLDVAAAEALLVPGLDDPPPIVCSLHAGLGGTIRRAGTGLPGGGASPVALVRIPRERMVGFGVASSLVHEVGHQAAALLGLVEPLRAEVRSLGCVRRSPAWSLWERWISEIVADLWAIGRIGIGSTLGLLGLVSLPRGLVFQLPQVHPAPWVRVLLSCAIGDRLYPDRQWGALARTWRQLYPPPAARAPYAATVQQLCDSVPDLVQVLVRHRCDRLGGRTLGAVLRNPRVAPQALLRRFSTWAAYPGSMTTDPPTVAFAVLGQARASGHLTPERESLLLRELITHWAVASTLETARSHARTGARTFGGQPTIWAGPRHLPQRHLTAA